MTSLLPCNRTGCCRNSLPLCLWDPLVTLDLGRWLHLVLVGLLDLLGLFQELSVPSSLPLVLVGRCDLGRSFFLNMVCLANCRWLLAIHPSQNCLSSCIVPQVFVVVDHFQKGFLERTVCFPLLWLQPIDLLPDESICCHHERQAWTVYPELFELLQISQWTCRPRIATDVEVLQSHEEGMDSIQQSLNIRDLIWFVRLWNSQ